MKFYSSLLNSVRSGPFTSLALLVLIIAVFIPTWGHFYTWGSISWDAFGYYYYYKLVFIDHSLIIDSLDSVRPIFEQYSPSTSLYQFTALDNGRFIIRYPMGQAILYLPFFLIGHLIALFSDYPVDAYSLPYDTCMDVGGFIYTFLGLWLTAKILRLHFNDKVTGLSLIILFFGTNLWFLLAGAAFSAQASLYFLIALFIWLVDRYLRNKSALLCFGLGAIFGLICVNRPTDFIIIIVAAFWPVTIRGLKLGEEWKLFLRQPRHWAGFIIGMSLLAFLQFGYWKYVGGSWFINSYGNPGEGLDFLNPHTLPFLFSFKSGWLLYTPIMAIVLAFMIIKSFKKDKIMQLALIYTLVFIYLASTWTNWWYGQGFSQRAMGQAYVVLSLPLAGLIKATFFEKRKKLGGIAVLIVILAVFSIWQTQQYKRGIITGETMTKEYYFATLFDYSYDAKKAELRAVNRYEEVQKGMNVIPDGYELYKSIPAKLDADSIFLEGKEFTTPIREPYHKFGGFSHCWIALRAEFASMPNENLLLASGFSREEGTYSYMAHPAVDKVVSDTTSRGLTVCEMYQISPIVRSEKDIFNAYIWNRKKGKATLLELQVDIYAPLEELDKW